MKPGIYLDLDADKYHADPCDEPSLNYSTARELIQKSAWHAYKQHPRLGGKGRTASINMDRGNIVHALLLGQPLSQIEVIDADNYRRKATQELRDAAQAAGQHVMLRREYDAIQSSIPLIRAHLDESEVDLSGPCEATVIWNSDDILCRTRIDSITNNMCCITDLKCTEDANPKNLERHIDDMCYDLQAAIEIDAIETWHPELFGRVSFCDVFVEMNEPYFVVRADHKESMLEVGRSKFRRAKELWDECISSGVWPGYEKRIDVRATSWAYRREFGDQL